MARNFGFNGVDVLAFDSPEFVVETVASPTLPDPCHSIPRFAILGLNEIGGGI
jgi:hypothetical protein